LGNGVVEIVRKRAVSLIAIVALIVISVCAPIAHSVAQTTPRKPAGSALKIVEDDLVENGDFYAVKGSIYNPNAEGVKNVIIHYRIWKKWMGTDAHGSLIKETGGLVTATIKYLPPKTIVEYVAKSHLAPVMSEASGLEPDPIDAEISAEWDE
jgi:hypothetical protein